MHVVVPVVGAVVFAAALYGSVHPTPPGILQVDAASWPWSGWSSALGCCWLRARRPEAVAQIGSILGEEGGRDAAVLDK